ncbi:fumarylacetoacetate hydrolase family protein [Cohnella fermenti]|uniref:Fumarylacetoacetate hydrolase family protein n=1 Tax=Cohnella fermenti TaxID=2565925 RepID=A0A4S4BZB8_9BACL|nr:fumarylacetoacetate hydrolase family protein [Cohnella fermenti]THF79937.1 fumarylacetoacetate hydrolase family protein [Cohnella fermenti]
MTTFDIRNIYCVGRNYRLHAAELGNAVPEQPMIFTKPTHAAVAWEQEVRLPADRGAVHYEAELVLLFSKPYKPGDSLDDAVSHFTVGLDFTLRDVQEGIKAKGYPWLPAKGFRNSAGLGEWRAYPGTRTIEEKPFALAIGGKEVQRGDVRDMVHGLEKLADFVATHYGIGAGDLLFTGTPAGVGALNDGDVLTLTWNEENVGSAKVVLSGD